MVIDINVLIAALKAEPPVAIALSEWWREGRGPIISSVSLAETLSIATLIPTQITVIKSFLSNFISVPFNDSLGEIVWFIRQVYRFGLPDAAIAATALSRNLPLVTRDRQFKKNDRACRD